jgi:hypothetical protein
MEPMLKKLEKKKYDTTLHTEYSHPDKTIGSTLKVKSLQIITKYMHARYCTTVGVIQLYFFVPREREK